MKPNRFDPEKWDKMMNEKFEGVNKRISKRFGVPIELVRLHGEFLKFNLLRIK